MAKRSLKQLGSPRLNLLDILTLIKQHFRELGQQGYSSWYLAWSSFLCGKWLETKTGQDYFTYDTTRALLTGLSDLSTDRWAQEWMHLSLLFLVKKSIDLVHIAFKKHPGASAPYGLSCWVKLSISLKKFPRISDVGYWIWSSSSDWPITHTDITISYSIDLGVLIPRYVKKGQSQYTEMISPNGYDPKRGFNWS